MKDQEKGLPGKPRSGYRRHWRRAAAEDRLRAAATLRDFGATRRKEWILLVMLAASLALHAVLVGLVPSATTEGQAAAAAEDSYLQKVMQKDRAKYAAANGVSDTELLVLKETGVNTSVFQG